MDIEPMFDKQCLSHCTCSESVLRVTRSQFEIRGAEMCLARTYLAAKGEKKKISKLFFHTFFFCVHCIEQNDIPLQCDLWTCQHMQQPVRITYISVNW